MKFINFNQKDSSIFIYFHENNLGIGENRK